jgi:molecular chaperone GrpE (heat shock protein)
MEEIKKDDSQENMENEEFQGTTEEEMALMQKELEDAKTKSEEAIGKMMRLAAEFDNYKKRSARI